DLFRCAFENKNAVIYSQFAGRLDCRFAHCRRGVDTDRPSRLSDTPGCNQQVHSSAGPDIDDGLTLQHSSDAMRDSHTVEAGRCPLRQPVKFASLITKQVYCVVRTHIEVERGLWVSRDAIIGFLHCVPQTRDVKAGWTCCCHDAFLLCKKHLRKIRHDLLE